MNRAEMIQAVRETPAVHQLLLSTRDRSDLSSRERGLTLAAMLATLLATRGVQIKDFPEEGKATILALNEGGELHELAPAPGGRVVLYTSEQAWGPKSAWGFVTVSAEGTHSRSGASGDSDLDTQALTAILEGLMSVPHGSRVQVYSRNMNADGYLTGRYRAKTPGLQSLIDDIRTVVARGNITAEYAFLTDRASRSHTALNEAEALTLETIRKSA